MHSSDTNASLSPLLRATNILVAIVLVAGGSLFFAPDLLGPRGPWQIAPFNTHFLAAIYLSELTAVGAMIAINRWVPVRLVLPEAVAFTVIVTGVSFAYLDRFDGQKLTTWAWFVLYIVPMVVLSFFLWKYRALPVPGAMSTPQSWRIYLVVQGGVLLTYGLGLLLAPATFSAFWPWKIDDFHGRIYSGIFVAAAVGSLILFRRGATIEFVSMGIGQVVIGLFSVLGLVLVDASTHRVDWAQLGTWVWIALFIELMLAGVALIYTSMRQSSSLRSTVQAGV